ncbi:Nn.00g045180.m01.CDS01 [Neocucurbitaria sp. VM-36]
MSTHPPARSHRLYPAYCFRASPTFDIWVKLTAADVQALRSEPDFQGQHIYFHLNHPIRYVRLVGVIVAIDDINTKYTVLTIDDGSGANIELKIVRILQAELTPMDSTSNTTIDNVNVVSQFGVFEVLIDNHRLDIGTVIKAKGTITEFRGIKQLDLRRVWVVTTTNEEAQAWAEAAAFRRDILSTPWRISSAEHKKIKNSIKSEKKKLQEYERRKLEHEAKKKEQKEARELYTAQREVRLEMRRRREEIIMNAGALK